MSDKRKLTTEMDRTLRKIQEGCEEYDEDWKALHDAETQKIREKVEEKINRVIKKMQRLRDQVRAWIDTPDVKEKAPLNKARRDVEERMEKLRDYERESKTKLYSKAGLAQDKVDPVVKNKCDAGTWLSESISRLLCQIEQFESEAEAISSGAGRHNKLDKDKQDKVEFVENALVAHRAHLSKFEAMLRMLDNETLDPEMVFDLKDEFEFYMDSAADGILVVTEQMYYGIVFDEQSDSARTKSPVLSVASATGSSEVSSSENGDTIATPPVAAPISPVQTSKSVPKAPKPVAKTNGVIMKKEAKNHAVSTQSKFDARHNKAANHPFRIQAQSAASAKAVRRSDLKNLTTVKEEYVVTEQVALVTRSKEVAKVYEQSRLFSELVSPKARKPVVDDQRSEPVKPLTPRTAAVKNVLPSPLPVKRDTRIPWTDSAISWSSPVREVNAVPPVVPIHSSPSAPVIRREAWTLTEPDKEEIPPSAVINGRKTTPEKTAAASVSQYQGLIVTPTRKNEFEAPGSRTVSTNTEVPTAVYLASAKPLLPPASVPRIESEPFSPQPAIHLPETVGSSSYNPTWGHSQPGFSEWPDLSPGAINNCHHLDGSHRMDTRLPFVGLPENNMALVVCPRSVMSAFSSVAPAEDFFLGDRNRIQHNMFALSANPQPRSQSSAVFETDVHYKLSVECLFYIFYHQGDNISRARAAKDLEMRNWSFHTKLKVWMHRVEYPKEQTSEYEKGDFTYWDVDGWHEQTLANFCVEYRYILLPSEELSRAIR